MHPLFSDAPVLQSQQVMPAQMPGSQLAAALSRPTQMPNLPPASFGNVPLASLMDAMRRANAMPSAQALNSAPTGQGGMIQQNAPGWSASTQMPQDPSWLSQIAPQMPGSFGVVNPNAGSLPIQGVAGAAPVAGATAPM